MDADGVPTTVIRLAIPRGEARDEFKLGLLAPAVILSEAERCGRQRQRQRFKSKSRDQHALRIEMSGEPGNGLRLRPSREQRYDVARSQDEIKPLDQVQGSQVLLEPANRRIGSLGLLEHGSVCVDSNAVTAGARKLDPHSARAAARIEHESSRWHERFAEASLPVHIGA